MKTTVFVEKIGKRKFRASTAQPIAVEAEGRSHEEAIARLRETIKHRLSDGEFVQVSIHDLPLDNPWAEFAGIWKDHPDFKAFERNVAEYRRNANK